MWAGWGQPVGAVSDSLYYETRAAMGTTFEVYLYAESLSQAMALFESAFLEIERVEAAISTYRASSELSRINREAARKPVTTNPEVLKLIQRALLYSARTGGAFDPTVGPLVEAWGFFRGSGKYPSEDALNQARTVTGWQHVSLAQDARTIAFDREHMMIDLGGVGKGYAIDRVAAVLRSEGVRAALIGGGTSSYYALGAPPGLAGWAIDIPAPFGDNQSLATVTLNNQSLSTSGNYRRFFELEGQRYSHIIDPRTGHPVQGRVQVTVVAPRAEDSDALSTALFVMGPDAGQTLLQALPETGALMVAGLPASPALLELSWNETTGTAALSHDKN